MRYILKYLLVVFLLFSFADSKSQSIIDSLLKVLPTQDVNGKISVYLDLALEYYNIGEHDLAQENANQALNLSHKINNETRKASALNLLSLIAYSKGNISSCITSAEKALEIGIKLNNLTIKANAYKYLGLAYFQKAEYKKVLNFWEQSLSAYESLNDKSSSAQLLSNIGLIYKNWGEYKDAISYYERALDIYKDLNDEIEMARIYGNIGNVYFYNEVDYDNALLNYQKAIKVFREKELKKPEAQTLLSIGLIFERRKLYDEALDYYKELLNIAEEINDTYWKAQALSAIGNINMFRNNFDVALDHFNEALKIFQEKEQTKDVAITMQYMGNLYFSMGDLKSSREYYLKSIELCEELDLKKELSDNYEELSNVYAGLNDYKNAYKYHTLYSQLNDSIFSAEYKDLITEWNARLENAEKEAALREQDLVLKKQKAELTRKNIIMYSAIGVILMVLIFSSLLYKQFREKKKANILLKDQNEEIKSQRDKIFEQNKEITDSIEYASKIQSAILPPNAYISGILPDYFILYRPRDIVSGDFYWINKFKNQIFLCAADCTGHGVPGAFMSMLGIALLNEIINKKSKFSAADILNNLRSQVVDSLHQKGYEGETQDGMDIAFCIIDLEHKKIQFSGAFNPLFIIRKKELIEFKGDKMPIGIHLKQHVPFTNHDIDYKPGDQIYLFSDGYADQFGGPNRKKFLIKRFRELLVENSNKSMSDQKTVLENTIDEWMGYYDQIDDILVFGAKLQ